MRSHRGIDATSGSSPTGHAVQVTDEDRPLVRFVPDGRQQGIDVAQSHALPAAGQPRGEMETDEPQVVAPHRELDERTRPRRVVPCPRSSERAITATE